VGAKLRRLSEISKQSVRNVKNQALPHHPSADGHVRYDNGLYPQEPLAGVISYNHIQHLVPGMMIAVFAFVGLTLPGMSRISHHDKTMKCHGKVLKCHEKVLKCHPKEYERPSYS